MILSFNKVFSVIIFLFCLFPYISFVDTPFDTQPYALIFSLLFLFIIYIFDDIKIPKLLIPFGIVLGYSIIMLYFSSDILKGIRNIVGYVSVFFLAIAGWSTFKNIRGKHFIFATVIWLVFGLVQTLIDKRFGGLLISSLRTSDARGVTSLATEPSLYAVICLFFFILNDIFFARGDYSKKIYLSTFLLITVQIFLARAGLGIVLFFIYLFSKMLMQINIFRMITWLFSMLTFGIFFVYLFSTLPSLQVTRLGILVQLFLKDPLSLFLEDASISDRMTHVIVSMVSLPFSYGIGFGLGNWGQFAPDIIPKLGWFIEEMAELNVGLGTKIMSGWGTAIFELGIFGLIFLLSFFYIMNQGIKKTKGNIKKVYISSMITIFFVMLMAIPLSFPLFGYIIGVFTQMQYDKEIIEAQ